MALLQLEEWPDSADHNTVPDSAIDILRQIDTNSLSKDQKIVYDVIGFHALYKKDVPLDTTGLLNLSDKPLKLKGYPKKIKYIYLYLRAFYQSQLRNYPDAMKDAMDGYKLASLSGDYFWSARTSQIISDVLSNNALWNEALKEDTITIANFVRAGRFNDAQYVRVGHAVDLDNCNLREKADTIFRSVMLSASTPPVDTTLLIYCGSNMANAYSDRSEYEKAQNVLNLVEQFGAPICYGSQYFYIKSLAALMRGDINISRQFLDSIDVLDEGGHGRARKVDAALQVTIAEGNYKKALQLKEELYRMDQDYISEVLKQSVVTTQRDFYDRQAREEEAQKKEAMLRLWLTIVASVCLVTAGCAFYFYRMRVKERRLKENEQRLRETEQSLREKQEEKMRTDEELKEKIDEILQLQSDLEEARKLDIRKSSQIVDLYQERQTFFNKVVSVYFRKKDSPNIKKTILNDLDQMINDMKREVKSPKLLEEINAVTGGLLDTLQDKCPSISKDEVMFIAMLYAGYIPLFIAEVCKFSPGYTYTKKSRILKKIEETLPDLPEELRKRL